MKVAVIEGILPTLMPEGPEIERKILGPDIEVNRYGVIEPDEYEAVLSDIDAAIVRTGRPFTEEMLSAMKKVRLIVSFGVGFDHICIEATKKRGIPVCNVPDYGIDEVADSTLALILALHRKIFLFHHKCANGENDWDWRINVPISRINRTQAGIIGLGKIGTAVAMRLKAFGYNVVFYDSCLPRGYEKSLGIGRVHEPEQLLGSSDIVSVHVPLINETAGMIDERFFEALKPEAILINTSRGGIFKDTDTIYKYLKERPGLRIGTDVWPEEPPGEHPLIKAWKNSESWLGDRLIICPHAFFYSKEAMQDYRTFTADLVRDVLKGGKPYNVVNGVGL